MREARTLASWIIALFVVAMLAWVAADTLAPQPPAKNHLFEVFRASSDIALFEPTGRFAFGALEVLAALLILIPFTRRIGAILATLVLVVMGALVVQLVMQGIKVPVDAIGANGQVTTTDTDASTLLYLTLGMLAASAALIFVHPGSGERAPEAPGKYYKPAR
jgi:hypothetical protein